MAFKLQNFRFAEQTVYIGNEGVEFDKDGVGEIESEELRDSLLAMPNFHAVPDKEEVEEKVDEPEDKEPEDEEPKDEEPKDEEPKDEEPKDEEPKAPRVPELVTEAAYNHNELNAKAKELGIEVDGTKPEKVKAINDYIIANF